MSSVTVIASFFRIEPIPVFENNYIWAIRNHHFTAIVDPGAATPVLAYLQRESLELVAILITHHHSDHTAGILPLLQSMPGVPVYGPSEENIPGVNRPLNVPESSSLLSAPRIQLEYLGLECAILKIPGHTLGHIAYYCCPPTDGQGFVFCGDTLFATGCGRLFEGSAAQMLHSLQRLAALPEKTLVYCAHEYTLANIAFALEFDADNPVLQMWQKKAMQLRAKNLATIPTSIEHEKLSNPFLSDLRLLPMLQKLKPEQQFVTALDVFTALRQLKDQY